MAIALSFIKVALHSAHEKDDKAIPTFFSRALICLKFQMQDYVGGNSKAYRGGMGLVCQHYVGAPDGMRTVPY